MRLKLFAIVFGIFMLGTVLQANRLSQISTGINNPMTRTQIADTMKNGETAIHWHLRAGTGGHALDFDIDHGDPGTAIEVDMNAHSQVGGRAAGIVVNLTTGLEGVQLNSTGADSAATQWSGGGGAYIIFDSTKAWQTVNFVSPLSATRVRLIKAFNNYSSGCAVPLFYNGDDYYYDTISGGDSVYFDHLSGDDPYAHDIASQNLPWPSTGDSLALLSNVYAITSQGKQGEALWITNSNGGKGATGWGSAPITITNANYLSMPTMSLKNTATAWTTGLIGFGNDPSAAFIHLYMSDCSPNATPKGVGGSVSPPLTYYKCYAIYSLGGEFQMGTEASDSMHVAGHTKFDNDVKVGGELVIPYGADWPESPQTGSLYYKTTNDTLGFYNGSAWKKFIPDA